MAHLSTPCALAALGALLAGPAMAQPAPSGSPHANSAYAGQPFYTGPDIGASNRADAPSRRMEGGSYGNLDRSYTGPGIGPAQVPGQDAGERGGPNGTEGYNPRWGDGRHGTPDPAYESGFNAGFDAGYKLGYGNAYMTYRTAGGSEGQHASTTQLDKDAIRQQLTQQGYSDIRDLQQDGGRYEARASRNGQDMRLTIDGSTGNVLGARPG